MSDVMQFEQRGLCKVDPAARGVDINIRLATQDDFAFIDALHKASDGIGFLCAQAFQRRIDEGNVLIAEAAEAASEQSTVNSEQ